MVEVKIERDNPTPDIQDWNAYVRFTLADWCWTNVGSGTVFNDTPNNERIQDLDWYAIIWFRYAEFYFHDSKQALMFKLRWA